MHRGPIRVVLLKQVTTGTSAPIDVSGLTHAKLYLIGYGTTSGGTITYEESTDDPFVSNMTYGGTWSAIGSAHNASDVSTGKQAATNLTVGEYARVRARISSTITGGGTVSVVLVASA